MEALAPIGVSTYGRANHLRQVIEALKGNVLAKDSELYIFSDAPRLGDEEKVRAVRQYARAIDGFKSVHVLERTTNNRVANNRGGIESLLDEYGKVIFLEEDVVVAPGFLRFMNDALAYYEDDLRIGSIAAYCPPMAIPDNYDKDVFTLTRLNPWGIGLWRRYYKMNTPISADCYAEVFGSRKKLRALTRSVGQEAVEVMKMDFERKLDAGDMKSIFWQFYDGKLTIYPKKSLSRSIGQDGSGFHMGITDKWDVSEMWDKENGFAFSRDIEVDEGIRKSHYDFYRVNIYKLRIVEYLRRIGVYEAIRPAIKKVQSWIGANG